MKITLHLIASTIADSMSELFARRLDGVRHEVVPDPHQLLLKLKTGTCSGRMGLRDICGTFFNIVILSVYSWEYMTMSYDIGFGIFP